MQRWVFETLQTDATPNARHDAVVGRYRRIGPVRRVLPLKVLQQRLNSASVAVEAVLPAWAFFPAASGRLRLSWRAAELGLQASLPRHPAWA